MEIEANNDMEQALQNVEKQQLKAYRLTREGLKAAVHDVSENLKKPWKSLPTFFLLQKPGSPVKGTTTIQEVWVMINDIEDSNPVDNLQELMTKRVLHLKDGSKLFATSKK